MIGAAVPLLPPLCKHWRVAVAVGVRGWWRAVSDTAGGNIGMVTTVPLVRVRGGCHNYEQKIRKNRESSPRYGCTRMLASVRARGALEARSVYIQHDEVHIRQHGLILTREVYETMMPITA